MTTKTKSSLDNISRDKHPIHAIPTDLLTSLLTCQSCGGSLVQVEGNKGILFYGCDKAQRKECSNHVLVERKAIETILLKGLKEKSLQTKSLEAAFENIEKTIAQVMKTTYEHKNTTA